MIPPDKKPELGEEAALYELEEPSLPRPDLPGEVVVRATADELIDRVAADLVLHAENCVREFGDFHLALSGGAIFDPLYRRLMYDPNCRRLPWRRTHLWLVEEPCVPLNDDRSSFRMISETLGDHADIPPEQFHPIFAEAETAPEDYERQVREALGWREKGQDRLDYVLLTMHEDGGTAGIGPFASGLDGPVAAPEERLVARSENVANDAPDRVTMTLPFLNAARFMAVLVTGSERADAVDRLVRADESPEAFPILGIKPINGELKWYLDAPACGDVQ